jgi:hypothetical protein
VQQSAVSSSWRLWPFTGWREASGRQQPPGSSPPVTSGGSAIAAGAAAGRGLQPSGGSFTNLRALIAPAGSKSAPDRSLYNAGAADGEGRAAAGQGDGGAGLKSASFPAPAAASPGRSK